MTHIYIKISCMLEQVGMCMNGDFIVNDVQLILVWSQLVTCSTYLKNLFISTSFYSTLYIYIYIFFMATHKIQIFHFLTNERAHHSLLLLFCWNFILLLFLTFVVFLFIPNFTFFFRYLLSFFYFCPFFYNTLDGYICLQQLKHV